jgi:uncharacterized membrane protein
VQAQTLAETLAAHHDPSQRARHYYQRTRALLQVQFDLSIGTDRMYRIRAKLSRGLRVSPREWILNHAYERAWIPALQTSPLVVREMVKAMQMREVSSLGVRLRMVLYLLRLLILSWFRRGKAPVLDAGPARGEFLRSLPERSDRAAST